MSQQRRFRDDLSCVLSVLVLSSMALSMVPSTADAGWRVRSGWGNRRSSVRPAPRYYYVQPPVRRVVPRYGVPSYIQPPVYRPYFPPAAPQNFNLPSSVMPIMINRRPTVSVQTHRLEA